MISTSLHLSLKETGKFLVTFYCVGVAGMTIPITSSFFRLLIPYSLLMCFVLLAVFHQGKQSLRDYLVYLTIVLTGYMIEVAGVETGWFFGRYLYGNNLGLKIANTPLLIGFNWLFLVYSSASVVNNLRIPVWLKVLSASLIMVVYDLIVEQVAPDLDLWSWADNVVPLKNYVAWFVLSLIFHTSLRVFRVSTKNPLAIRMLVVQMGFFLSLQVIFSILD